MIAHIKLFVILIIVSLVSGCATILGGKTYHAYIVVKDRPGAEIYYKQSLRGRGIAEFEVPRGESGKFSVVLKEAGCPEQVFHFTSKKFRWISLLGIGYYGIPTLYDIVVGSVWKPDVFEPGVAKVSYKSYSYLVEYTNCNNPIITTPISPNTPSMAQPKKNNNVTIYMKNGMIFKGVIIEEKETDEIVFKTEDNNIQTFKKSRIDRIENQ